MDHQRTLKCVRDDLVQKVMLLLRSLQDRLRVSYVLVWHDDHEAFARILVGLQLIILRVDSSRVAQEQQKLGR